MALLTAFHPVGNCDVSGIAGMSIEDHATRRVILEDAGMGRGELRAAEVAGGLCARSITTLKPWKVNAPDFYSASRTNSMVLRGSVNTRGNRAACQPNSTVNIFFTAHAHALAFMSTNSSASLGERGFLLAVTRAQASLFRLSLLTCNARASLPFLKYSLIHRRNEPMTSANVPLT